jgi:ApbE superfamily uncharacterized protein (UPF0280 family)
MSGMQITVTRATALTFLTSDLSVADAQANAIIDAIYGGASGTPTKRFEDSRALRTLCERHISAENTQLFFIMMGIEF